MTGARIANKNLVTPTSLTAVSGYVQQDDLFIPSLTVREHLIFQARVRMDKDIPMEQRMAWVEKVILELGLRHALSTSLFPSPSIFPILKKKRKRSGSIKIAKAC